MARDGLENRNLGQSRSHSDEVEYPEAGGSREGSLGECARSTLRPHCRSKEEWSSCSGSGGCQGSELRPCPLRHRHAAVSSLFLRSPRQSRICRLKFPLAPQCRWSFSPPNWAAGWWCEAREGRTRVCLAIMARGWRVARLQQPPLVFPIPLHLLLITVSTPFFMLPRVAIGARLRLMSTMAQSLTPMEDAMRAKETDTPAFNVGAPRITFFLICR